MLKTKEIKIAIVEDNEFFNKSLVKYIQTICDPEVYQKFSFKIKSFANANEAIQELEDDLDLIILDYFLIDPASDEYLNGVDVLNEIQKHCDHCTVILMSEYLENLDQNELQKKGVHEFVNKKINSKNRLGSLIQQSLSRKVSA